MNKMKITPIIFAALIAVFVSGTVLLSSATRVLAAEQANQEQPAPPENAPKDGSNEHLGHHM